MKKMITISIRAVFALLLLAGAHATIADTFTSSNYQMQTPVILPGGYGSSASFKLLGVIDIAGLASSSSSSFALRPGFLAYPFVSSPVVSATAGSSQVALSWTAATGYVGWTASGYSVGKSTTSGGPYTFTNVGNVLSSTQSSLTNGTTYYFVVRVLDAFSNVIATSSQASAAPAAAAAASSGGGGGGGGGGAIGIGGSTVFFSGRAYPNSAVTLLKDAQVAGSITTGADASFSLSVANISAGNYIFSVYGEDKKGNRSSLQSFPVSVIAYTNTNVTGIFIAPTIDVDKSEVRRGDNLSIFGSSAPSSTVVIMVNSETELFLQTKSGASGDYLYTFDTSPLEIGSHSAKSKAAVQNTISSFGAAAVFSVGSQNKSKTAGSCKRGDLNCDSRINLVDFSIMAYWYKKPLSGTGIKSDLNGDSKVDLIDFSILVFNWTG